MHGEVGRPQAPIVVKARRIITMTPDRPEALAVVGEHVVATGRVGDLLERFPGAEVIDCGDGVIVPGFNDAHMHLAQAAEGLLHVDLSIKAVRSLAELKDRLRREASRVPAGQWIQGGRYDDARMAEGRGLTRWDLDEVSREHPLLVIHVAGHWGVANSLALERGGIDETTQPPAGGAFGRDASGRLNGVLYEQALFDFAYPAVSRRATTVVPPSPCDELLGGLDRAVEMFHAAGLTSVGDALVGPRELRLFQEGLRRGILTLRVNMLVTHEHYDLVRRLGLRTGFGGDRLRLGGIKLFVDGAIGGRTCLLEEPFEGTAEHGIQTIATRDLAAIVRRVHEDGNRVAVHANGDRAISLLLDQLEAAHAACPRPALQHRIEHCTVVTEEIVARMRRLGVIAVPFGSYVYYHGGHLIDWYGERRVRRMFAHRWLLDAGVAVAGSSDYPCGPYEPLLALQSCTTRRGWDGVLVGENQRITPAEALALYTTGAAYASEEDHVKGRLAPGYLADFVVLEDDPLSVEPSALGAIAVRETYVGGRRVWPRR